MKKFAVGYLNAFDNDLKIEIINADTWHKALMLHSGMSEWEDVPESSLEDAKKFMFDCDAGIDVVEIN